MEDEILDTKLFSVSFDVEVPIFSEEDYEVIDEDYVENAISDSLTAIGVPSQDFDLGYMEVVEQEG